ncbi:hypothetical protein [Ramlibacter humi]|uniref:DUF4124 domain-containing protein n=1 Tax=Ramlibacter humi TaxID=2530451 RepID=A0A4Z0CEA7_9BURK|nr:hypothetical protein [Ramlibacter humi]TFZ08910.1 hypothetical protein EZ216_07140 [Ramlibacter humi]
MTIAARTLLATSIAFAGAAPAQDTVYPPQVFKCGRSYSQTPCEGGGPIIGASRVSQTFDAPDQSRARQMARAQLPPETREQCEVLERSIQREESRLRGKPSPATEAELGDLAIQRVHYREMRC